MTSMRYCIATSLSDQRLCFFFLLESIIYILASSESSLY